MQLAWAADTKEQGTAEVAGDRVPCHIGFQLTLLQREPDEKSQFMSKLLTREV